MTTRIIRSNGSMLDNSATDNPHQDVDEDEAIAARRTMSMTQGKIVTVRSICASGSPSSASTAICERVPTAVGLT